MSDLLESFSASCELGRGIPAKLVVICEANRQSLKYLLVTVLPEKKLGHYTSTNRIDDLINSLCDVDHLISSVGGIVAPHLS